MDKEPPVYALSTEREARAVMTQADTYVSRKSGNFPALALTADRGELSEILTEFSRRYSNPKTASDYRRTLTHLFRWTTARHPAELSESDLLAWITHGSPANNTVYQRTTKVCTFLRWCLRAELIDRNPAEHLREQHSPLRTFTRTYGKVQGRNPGRWLTRDEAFGTLVPSCNDARQRNSSGIESGSQHSIHTSSPRQRQPAAQRRRMNSGAPSPQISIRDRFPNGLVTPHTSPCRAFARDA